MSTQYRAVFDDGRKGPWHDTMTAAALELLEAPGWVEASGPLPLKAEPVERTEDDRRFDRECELRESNRQALRSADNVGL